MAKCCNSCGVCCKVIMFFFTVCGIVFSFIAGTSCEFFATKFGEVRTFGIYEGQAPGGDVNGEFQCVRYKEISDYEPAGPHQTAWICAAVAPLCGFIALVAGLIQFFFCNVCCAKCCISIPFTAAQICQLLTFFMFDNQFCSIGGLGCELGNGGIYSIVAWACYFIASILLCFTPTPEPVCCKKDDGSSRDCCGKKKDDEEAPEATEEAPKATEEAPKASETPQDEGGDSKKEGGLTPAVTE